MDKGFLEIVFSGNGRNRRSQPLSVFRRYDKGQYYSNKCRSTKDRGGNQIQSGNVMGGLLQAPMTNMVQSFPVTMENMSHQEN